MSGLAYFSAVRTLMQRLETQELPHIQALGVQLARSVKVGKVVHVYDNGHMLNHELFNRAGGLALVARLDISRPSVTNQVVRKAEKHEGLDSSSIDLEMDTTLARYAVAHSSMGADDHLIIGSVSGRSAFVVELALAAQDRGIHTIALTAVSYAKALPPLHASGKLLYQVTEDVIDMQTEAGDGALALEGLEEKLGPTSGVMAAVVMWSLEAELAKALIESGVTPTVFRSVNYPDGPKRLRQAQNRFAQRGY